MVITINVNGSKSLIKSWKMLKDMRLYIYIYIHIYMYFSHEKEEYLVLCNDTH